MSEHVSRQEVQLLGGHVGDHGGYDIHASTQGGREGFVEIAEESADTVSARAGNGYRISVGGYYGGPRMGRTENGRYRAASGAEIDCDPVVGQE